jgi:hypothetical protein
MTDHSHPQPPAANGRAERIDDAASKRKIDADDLIQHITSLKLSHRADLDLKVHEYREDHRVHKTELNTQWAAWWTL